MQQHSTIFTLNKRYKSLHFLQHDTLHSFNDYVGHRQETYVVLIKSSKYTKVLQAFVLSDCPILF